MNDYSKLPNHKYPVGTKKLHPEEAARFIFENIISRQELTNRLQLYLERLTKRTKADFRQQNDYLVGHNVLANTYGSEPEKSSPFVDTVYRPLGIDVDLDPNKNDILATYDEKVAEALGKIIKSLKNEYLEQIVQAHKKSNNSFN